MNRKESACLLKIYNSELLFRAFSVFFPIFAAMKQTIIMLLALVMPMTVLSQVAPEDREVEVDKPMFVPTTELKRTILDGDSALLMDLGNVYVYPVMELKSEK